MNNLNTTSSSDIKNTNSVAASSFNSKNNEIFEKLLKSDGGNASFQSSNVKVFSSDLMSALTGDYLNQANKNNISIQTRLKNNQSGENIELYDQKMYAIGKLSYIKKEVNVIAASKLLGEEPKLISLRAENVINTESNKFSFWTDSKNIGTINYSFLGGNIGIDHYDTKKSALIAPVVKSVKYEREKITEISLSNKTLIYIRNYFMPLEQLSDVASQYLFKFKKQIKLIINGAGGN